MAVYTETLDLKSNVATEAKSAASQMRTLQDSLTATRTAMVKAAATGGTMSKQYIALAKQATQYEAAAKLIPKALLQEADAQKKVAEARKRAAERSDALKDQASGILGLNDGLAEATGGLSVVAEAAGAAALAFGAVVVAGAAMAIEANEAKQRMVALFDALGEGQISGKETVAMIDELGDKLGQTRAQLAPVVQSFVTLGITGKEQLEGLTTAAASAGAMAEGGAEKFAALFGQVNAAAETGSKLTIPYKKLEKQLAGVGLNIGDLARQMGISQEALTKGLKAGTIDASKFGDALTSAASDKGAGALAKQGRSLSNIWAKFQENIMKLFEEVDVGPFLDQVKDLFDIFGQGKASGQALTAGIGGFFKGVFATATKVVPMVKHFFLDLVILGLRAYIALKPIAKWFLDLRNNATVMSVLSFALAGLGKVALVLAGAVAVVVGIFVVMTAAAGVVAAGLWTLIGVVSNVAVSILQFLGDLPVKALQFGKDFVAGLVSGITGSAGAVVDAVKGLADGAKNAFKNVLGIHSPSKVMAQMGAFAGQGVAQGLDSSAPDVHGAASDLGGMAASGAASGIGSSGGGKGGVTVNVEPGAIVIQGAGKGADELTEEAVAILFERVALAQGL